MHIISIAGSNHQKSRLRNGHKVRVKHGAGFNIIVNPNTYGLVSRAFNKNKGTTLQLSPEEISMNQGPSPEIQRHIMGHSDHLILPNSMGELIKGSGIKDFFKNKIIQPTKNLVNKIVPPSARQDLKTIATFANPIGLVGNTAYKLAKGEKFGNIASDYKNDLSHLETSKNNIIKSSPVLTQAYKKAVPALAGLATGAVGSAFGLSPVTGAVLGAAGTAGANALLKKEGFGLHHLIDMGRDMAFNRLAQHARPIGGALGMKHISSFFKNAGNKVKSAFQSVIPVAKQGAQAAHSFLLDHPELASKVKEHGSKLAGMLAKEGINYATGSDEYGDMAQNLGTDLASEQIHKNLGYGLTAGFGGHGGTLGYGLTAGFSPSGYGLTAGFSPSGHGLGTGLYAGKMRGSGPFRSFHTLRDASDASADANEELAGMSRHTIHNQHTQRPIAKYYDGDNQPPSRGTGAHPHNSHHIHQNDHLHQRVHMKHPNDHHNLIRGRGSLVEHDARLPQALMSQPYGTNFHMQFQLPPEYQKYNDGTYTF